MNEDRTVNEHLAADDGGDGTWDDHHLSAPLSPLHPAGAQFDAWLKTNGHLLYLAHLIASGFLVTQLARLPVLWLVVCIVLYAVITYLTFRAASLNDA